MGDDTLKQVDELEEQDELLKRKISVEEKKAIIKKFKKEYGSDWKSYLKDFLGPGGILGRLKPDKEKLGLYGGDLKYLRDKTEFR